MPDYAVQRTNMVDSQVRPSDVTDPRIHRAMLEIPRECFVFPQQAAVAYMENIVPLPNGRALADPRCLAKSVQLAAVMPTDRVLDVGCATGYSAALLARLVAEVFALEQDSELADMAAENLRDTPNAQIVRGSLAAGAPSFAPYDVIFVGGAVEGRPEALLAQLKEGGRLVAVVRRGSVAQATLFVRGEEGGISERPAFDAQLPILPGFARGPAFVF